MNPATTTKTACPESSNVRVDSIPVTDIEPSAKTDQEPTSKTDHNPLPKTDPESVRKMDPEPAPEIKLGKPLKTVSKVAPETVAEPALKSDPEKVLESDPGKVLESDPEKVLESDPEKVLESDLKSTPESDSKSYTEMDQSNPETSSKTKQESLPKRNSPARDRYLEIGKRIFRNRQMLRVPDLSCPVYVFTADLVQYVIRYYTKNSAPEWEFDCRFAHSSPATYFNYKVQNAVDACCDDRQVSIHLAYKSCFPEGCLNELHFQNVTEVLRGVVQIGIVGTVVHLLEFSCFVAQLSALAFSDELDPAPYRAIQLIHWNIVEFINKKCNGDPELVWSTMPTACHALEIRARIKDRTFFKTLCFMLSQSADDVNFFINYEDRLTK